MKEKDSAVAGEWTLDEGFENLEGLLSEMERDDVSIEEAFGLFEQGTALISAMHRKLADLEGRVEQITAEGELEEFSDVQ